jgi:FPC/CPF motif-containing protein YcgG
MSFDLKARDWTDRIIHGTYVGVTPPCWLVESYAVFRTNVDDDRYPCYFASEAERKGMLFYAFVNHGDIEHLPATLATFVDRCKNLRRDRNNLVVFFEPSTTPLTHEEYRTAFWDTLLFLQNKNPKPAKMSSDNDLSDPFWEFPFADNHFFVVGISPSHHRRRSRNLGPGMIIVFQPREIFLDYATGREICAEARTNIQQRVERWDGVPPPPDLNVYGHAGNREWAQYFVSDEHESATGSCPLAPRRNMR